MHVSHRISSRIAQLFVLEADCCHMFRMRWHDLSIQDVPSYSYLCIVHTSTRKKKTVYTLSEDSMYLSIRIRKKKDNKKKKKR